MEHRLPVSLFGFGERARTGVGRRPAPCTFELCAPRLPATATSGPGSGNAQRADKPADPEEACGLRILQHSRLDTELWDPRARCEMGAQTGVAASLGFHRLLSPETGARKNGVRAGLRGSQPRQSSYLALVAVDVADGIGHRVRAQQHARAAWPLRAHEVVFAHEDLAHVFCACHADQRPPQQVRFEHVAILLPSRRLEARTLGEPRKTPVSGRPSPDGMSRRPSPEGPRRRRRGSRLGRQFSCPPPKHAHAHAHARGFYFS